MSSDRTSLGDRMKEYEAVTKTTLPRRTYTIIRCDGRAFHTYLRNSQKPFDLDFLNDMDAVTAALCAEVSGSVFGYTQSDEISILAVDFQTESTEPWFGGQVQKIVSAAAAKATAELCGRRLGTTPTFDARVFTIDDPAEVANYFVWRQRDALRNSVSMVAQAHFSSRQLNGVNTSQMLEMLTGLPSPVIWQSFFSGARFGRVATRESGDRKVTYTHKRTQEETTVTARRSWWEVNPAPHFTLAPWIRDDDGNIVENPAGSFLALTIPIKPMEG